MRESVEENSRVKVEEGLWDDFAEGIFYQPGQFADRSAFRELAERLEQIDAARGTRGNKLFYLATPPSAYEEIVDNLGHVGLQQQGDHGEGWARIVVEKPFGHDLDSARRAQRRADHASSTSRRSTASTTTWAKRPSAT